MSIDTFHGASILLLLMNTSFLHIYIDIKYIYMNVLIIIYMNALIIICMRYNANIIVIYNSSSFLDYYYYY